MTFLPIVERELREGARKNSVRYIRLGVAAVALAIGLFQILFIPFFMSFSRTSGAGAFSFMTGYILLLCLLAGVFVAADCLSEEKREGTLGLLFLTDLRGYDVVIGKLAAQLINLGFALLAIIPAAALPLLLGGVTGGEVWRISLALANVLFFGLAVGLFSSSVCRRAGAAMLLTGFILLFFCGFVPSAQAMIGWFSPRAGEYWFGWLGPYEPYQRALEMGFLPAPQRYWQSLGGSHAVAWLFIVLACNILPRSWQERGAKQRKSNWLAKLGLGEGRVRRRRELLGRDPLRWLIGEQWSARAITWGFAIAWAIGMLGVGIVGRIEALFGVAVYGLWVLFPVKLIFAAQSTRFFVETRRSGAFDLLLATPVTTRELVAAQWAMLRRIFLPPAILVLASSSAATTYLFLASREEIPMRFLAVGFSGIIGLLYLASWALDFFALGVVGMWLALSMRKPHLATGATILFVLILPMFLCYFGFVSNVVLIAVFLTKLQGDFRAVALDQSRSLAGR